MATHSSILAWKIPQMEEPGRLQSIGSQSHTTELYYALLQETFLPQGLNPVLLHCRQILYTV